MKKLLYFAFFSFFAFFWATNAETISIDWLNEDGTLSQTTTCETGGDIILPATPTKPGYTFAGWVMYTPIEYLESTGTQYIDTGYTYASNLSARVIIDTTILTSANKFRVHGIAGNPNGGPNVGINDTGYFTYASNNDFPTSVSGSVGTRYLFDLDVVNATFTVTDVVNEDIKLGTSLSSAALEKKNAVRISYWLFGYNNSPYAPYKFASRIYSAKLYDNGVLVRDMIPVLSPNGTPCMFDQVTNQFFYNAGTGNFTAGPVINE